MSKSKKINSVNMALEILNSFSVEKPVLGITELSKKLEVSKSTIHRLITTMLKQGYIERDIATQKYKLGLSILRLAEVINRSNDIRTISLPIMQQLRDQTGESVHLNIISYEQLARVCIAKYESFQGLRHTVEVGEFLPLHRAASGKTLLAYQNEQFVNTVLEQVENEDRKRKVREDLKQIRAQGYCFSVGERISGASSISAPIINNSKKVLAGLTISGPTIRFTPEKTEQFIDLLKETVAEISRQVGYQT